MEAVIRDVGRRFTHLVLSEQAILLNRVVIAECSRLPELGRTLYEAEPMRGRIRMAAFVERQMQAGSLRRGDAERMVDQFCEMCLSPLYRQRLMTVIPPPSEEGVGERVDAAVAVIMAAYRPETAPSPLP